LNDYGKHFERYVKPDLGEVKLCDLQPLMIQAVYSKMQEKALAPKTVRHAHQVLNGALKQAVRWRMVKYNPADGAQLPKPKRRNIKPLTEEQLPKLLEVAKREGPHYPMFLLAATTGLRPQEYVALNWESVDLDAGTVTVRQAMVYERSGKAGKIGDTKTPKGVRTIPLPTDTKEALREHQRNQRRARLEAGEKWKDQNLVFCTDRGGPLEVGNIATRLFKPLLDKAGLPKTTRLYDLRHTFVTLSLAAGVSPKTVSIWAGHASVSFTLDVYTHLIPSMERAGAEQIDRLFTSILHPPKTAGTLSTPKETKKQPLSPLE
jgi:integrase